MSPGYVCESKRSQRLDRVANTFAALQAPKPSPGASFLNDLRKDLRVLARSAPSEFLKKHCKWFCEYLQVKIWEGCRTLHKFSLASQELPRVTCECWQSQMFKKLAPGVKGCRTVTGWSNFQWWFSWGSRKVIFRKTPTVQSYQAANEQKTFIPEAFPNFTSKHFDCVSCRLKE